MARKPPATNTTAAGRGPRDNPTERLIFPAGARARVPTGEDDDYDNLLLASVRNDSIELRLLVPDQAESKDTVQLVVDGTPVGGEVVAYDYIDDEKGIPLPLAPELRESERVYQLRYHLVLHSLDGQVLPGPEQQFVVDYTSPGAPIDPQTPSINPPVFEEAVIDDGVTFESLVTDADGNTYLPALVDPYHGQAIGDVLLGYIDDEVATEPREVLPGEIDKSVDVRYTLEALEAVDGGRHDFSVKVMDRPENPPGFSDPVDLLVRLSALIPDLLPPRVPAAEDGLVDHDDAQQSGGAPPVVGVQVDIPGNDYVEPNDVVEVSWERYTSPSFIVEAGHEGDDPLLSLFVPYADVYGPWFDTSGGANQRVDASVTYRISRQGQTAGEPDTPTVVQVNLSVPGGEDPDPELPGHGALANATVFSASGSENFIPIGDRDSDDGYIVVPWDSLIAGREIFAEDDVVTVTFGQTTLPARTVTADEMTAKLPLRIPLPSSAIVAETTATASVFYVITRALVGGGSNRVTSHAIDVTLETTEDLPGGGKLAEGVFPEMNAHLTLGPPEIAGGTLFIGGYEGKAIGDEIRFEFVFVDGYRHLDGEPHLDDRFYSDSITLASADDPVVCVIPESALQYEDNEPEQMHIHAKYFVRRGSHTEVESPDTSVYLDCRGDR